MKVSDLLQNITTIDTKGDLDRDITSLHLDSRQVESGGLFFAVPGAKVDGFEYINDAVKHGAVAIVCEQLPSTLESEITYIHVTRTNDVVGPIASCFFDHPTNNLKIVGVTGTNGKTTTATLLYQLFQKLGHKSGLISTVENRIDDKKLPSTMTTPDAISLHKMFKEMVDGGCTHAFMEVSSHALVQGRVRGIDFTGAVFTNITHDHLDYHNTFEEYLKAKQILFDRLSPGAFTLANIDDSNGELILQNTKAAKYFYGLQQEDGSFSGEVQFEGKVLANTFQGLVISVNGAEIRSQLIGLFNAYNLLAVYGTALLLNADKNAVSKTLTELIPVSGRFQHIEAGGRVGIVDYAHTPDALLNVLETVHEIKSENQKVFTVIGCGGDRDTTKRPIMARIAYENSDYVIFTSDNPRTEDPEKIIDDMESGLDDPNDIIKVERIIDRATAIKRVAELAKTGDIILVAGKGHENYQEISGVKKHFDDMELLKENMK